jgi:YD repeat-containing protein
MKKLILLLLFIPLVSCDKKNSLSELNLNGKVKSVVTSYYEAEEKFRDIEKGELEYSIEQEFNDDGNIVEGNSYNKEGELTSKSKFKYDDDGNLIEETIYDKEGELTYKWEYEYDDDGNLIESNRYNKEGELNFKLKFKYDDGNLIEEKQYNEEGELTDKWEFKYDDDGNQIKVKHTDYSSDTKETTTSTYKYEEYDKKGNWTKRVLYRDDKPYQIQEREIEYY